jgi:simple sugar transport system ATP-binding protein
MYRGRILRVISPDTPYEEIGLLMAGCDSGDATSGDDANSGDAAPVSDDLHRNEESA